MSPRLLALLATLGLLVPAPVLSERPYQRLWREHFEKQEPTVLIEDAAPPIDLLQERYVYGDPLLSPLRDTAFPGAGTTPAEFSFKDYARGAYTLESGSPTRAIKALDEAAKETGSSWARIRLAQTAIALNDLGRAQTILEQVLEVEPENHRALLAMGELAGYRQKFDDAKTWYQRVLEVKPKNIAALEMLSQISYEVDRDFEATKNYSLQILHIDDKNPQAMLWQAEACAFTGDAQRAGELYGELIRFRPNLVERVAEVARRLTAMGRPADARILFEQAMVADPSRAETRRQWEQSVRAMDGEAGVRAAYEQLAAGNANDIVIQELLADYLKRTSDWEALYELRGKMLVLEPKHLNSLLDLAYHHLREKDFPAAEPFLERAMRLNPNDAEVYRRVGEAYLSHGDTARAKELFTKAVLYNESDLPSLDALARIAENAGDRAAAEAILREALEVSPANGFLLGRLGAFHLRGGDRVKARELFQQVIAISPGDTAMWLALAQMALEDDASGQLDLLEKEAARHLNDNTKYLFAYADLTRSFGEFQRARPAYERVVLLAPASVDARYGLAQTYLHLQLPDLAVAVMEGAEPHLANAEIKRHWDIERAVVLLDLNRPAEAEALLAPLVAADSSDLEAQKYLLLAQIAQGRRDEAEKYLADVVRLQREAQPTSVALLQAAVLRELGDPARTTAVLREATNQSPEDAALQLELARSLDETGDLAAAEKIYRALIARGAPPENEFFEVASNNLAYMLAVRGIRLDEAETLAKDALALNPRGAYILDTLGWINFKQGDLAEARQLLERATHLSWRCAETLSNLGQVYEKLGKQDLAREAYDRALRSDPDFQIARERKEALAAPTSGEPVRQ